MKIAFALLFLFSATFSLASCGGNKEPEPENYYTITWKNDDGSTLSTTEVKEGEMPVYDKGTPTKQATVAETFTFDCWTPKVVRATQDTTYTAAYSSTKNKYMVSWYSEDVLLHVELLEYGSIPTYHWANKPTKAETDRKRYDWNGWKETITAVTGDTDYHARFDEVNRYLITFKNEDGTVLDESYVAADEMPSYDGTPTKPADAQYTYTFAGWDKKIVMPTADTVYTATYTYTTNKYLITWVNDDGKTLFSENVEYGKTPVYGGSTPTKPATAAETFTFSGWSPVVEAVTGEATYTATYTSTTNKYTITWKNYDDSTLYSEDVAYGTTPTYKGTTPTKPTTVAETFTFSGWSPTIVAVTGAATYTATFTSSVTKHTISWYNGTTLLHSEELEYGATPSYHWEDKPTKAETDRKRYDWNDWEETIATVTGPASYHAHFDEVNKYLITFKNYDEEVLQQSYVASDTLPSYDGTPTKPADAQYTYYFEGWDKEVVKPTEDTTYTATYSHTTNKYLISWYNGATLLHSEDLEYGSTPSYHWEDKPTKVETDRKRYDWNGWEESVVSVTGKADYHAHFDEVNKYLITYVNWDGTELQKSYVASDSMPSYTGATPIKTADAQYTYAFEGWDKDEEYPTCDTTYTATYSHTTNKYLITWKNDNGDTLFSENVAYGTVPEYEGATPTKEATVAETFTFKGWSPEVTAVTGEKTYIATYTPTPKEYTITWKGGINGDVVLKTETLAYGATPTAPEDVPETLTDDVYEYTFLNTWSPVVTKVTGDATYVAQYSQNLRSYEVTWKNWNGDPLKKDSVVYGTTPYYTGNTPTKIINGHSFEWIGWDKEILPVTKAEVYQAVFDNDITFDFEGINCTINGKDEFTDVYTFGEPDSIDYIIKPIGTYESPDTVSVYIDDNLVSTDKYTYNKTTGFFSVASNLGNIRLEVVGA